MLKTNDLIRALDKSLGMTGPNEMLKVVSIVIDDALLLERVVLCSSNSFRDTFSMGKKSLFIFKSGSFYDYFVDPILWKSWINYWKIGLRLFALNAYLFMQN